MKEYKNESDDVRVSKTTVLGCRMPVDEVKAVELAAAALGESLSEYVRKALFLRRGGMLSFLPAVSISIGTQYMQVDNNILRTRTPSAAEPANFVIYK